MLDKNLSPKQLKKIANIFAIIFLLIAFYPNFFTYPQKPWAFFSAIIFFLSGNLYPQIWQKPYLYWMKIGQILAFINTKILLFLVFFFIITPLSFFMKIFQKNSLYQKYPKNKKTYWVSRNTPPVSMKNQF